jgi:hypothetical protein
MAITAEKEYRFIGATAGAKDHDYDLLHELTKRLESLWRSDQYIANAEQKPKVQEFWRDLKRQEQQNVKRLKELLCEEIKGGCF